MYLDLYIHDDHLINLCMSCTHMTVKTSERHAIFTTNFTAEKTQDVCCCCRFMVTV